MQACGAHCIFEMQINWIYVVLEDIWTHSTFTAILTAELQITWKKSSIKAIFLIIFQLIYFLKTITPSVLNFYLIFFPPLVWNCRFHWPQWKGTKAQELMNNKRYLNEMGGGRVSGPAHGGQWNRGCCDLLRVINRALQSAAVSLSPSTPSQCLLFHDQSARHRTCPPGRGRTKHEVRTTEFPSKLRLEQRQMFIYFPHGEYK